MNNQEAAKLVVAALPVEVVGFEEGRLEIDYIGMRFYSLPIQAFSIDIVIGEIDARCCYKSLKERHQARLTGNFKTIKRNK